MWFSKKETSRTGHKRITVNELKACYLLRAERKLQQMKEESNPSELARLQKRTMEWEAELGLPIVKDRTPDDIIVMLFFGILQRGDADLLDEHLPMMAYGEIEGDMTVQDVRTLRNFIADAKIEIAQQSTRLNEPRQR